MRGSRADTIDATYTLKAGRMAKRSPDAVELFEKRLASLTTQMDAFRNLDSVSPRPSSMDTVSSSVSDGAVARSEPQSGQLTGFEAAMKRSKQLLDFCRQAEPRTGTHSAALSASSWHAKVDTESPQAPQSLAQDDAQFEVASDIGLNKQSAYSQEASVESSLSVDELNSDMTRSPQDDFVGRVKAYVSPLGGQHTGEKTIAAKLLAKIELQEEELLEIRLNSARQVEKIQRQTEEMSSLRHKIQEVILQNSAIKKECDILKERFKDQVSEADTLRYQLECSLDVNRTIQKQLNELKTAGASLDDAAISRANLILKCASEDQIDTSARPPSTPVIDSPMQRGWV